MNELLESDYEIVNWQRNTQLDLDEYDGLSDTENDFLENLLAPEPVKKRLSAAESMKRNIERIRSVFGFPKDTLKTSFKQNEYKDCPEDSIYDIVRGCVSSGIGKTGHQQCKIEKLGPGRFKYGNFGHIHEPEISDELFVEPEKQIKNPDKKAMAFITKRINKLNTVKRNSKIKNYIKKSK